MFRYKSTVSLSLFLIMVIPNIAFAYVGPGAGITMLSAMWGVIITIVLAVFGLLFWPIRSALKRKKNKQEQTISNEEHSEEKSE